MTAVGVPLLNHYVIKPHTEDKKNRLAYHHDKIREILKKWCEIKAELSKTKTALSDIAVPLYVTTIDQTKIHDEFEEAIAHLSNTKYVNGYALYQSIVELQYQYNKCVSKTLCDSEKRIDEQIQKVDNFKIINRDYFLSIIFDYLYRLSKGQNAELSIRVYTPEDSAWVRCRLCPSYDDEKIIIDTLNVDNKTVTEVKTTLDKVTEEIVNRLKICNGKFTLLKSKTEEFQKEINKIVHESEVLGLYGNCEIENKLKIRRKILKKLKSFFRIN